MSHRLIASLLSAALVACGAGFENTTAADATPTAAPTASQDATVQDAAPNEPDAAPEPPHEFLALGGLTLGMEPDAVQNLLGDPSERTEPALWGADGLYHFDWSYPSAGLRLGFVAHEATSRAELYSLSAEAPCGFKTPQGIGVDSTAEALRQAYPNLVLIATAGEGADRRQVLGLGSVYGGTHFEVVDGRVASVFVGAAAE